MEADRGSAEGNQDLRSIFRRCVDIIGFHNGEDTEKLLGWKIYLDPAAPNGDYGCEIRHERDCNGRLKLVSTKRTQTDETNDAGL